MKEIKFKALERDDLTGRITAHYYGIGGKPQLLGGNRSWLAEDLQYIGIKDTNRQEIYEGDYILGMMYQAPALVMYDERYCCYKAQIGTKLISLGYECKIVGNKYENPKL